MYKKEWEANIMEIYFYFANYQIFQTTITRAI